MHKQDQDIEAESLYREEIAVRRTHLATAQPASLTGLAVALREQEKYAEADEHFERALAINDEAD